MERLSHENNYMPAKESLAVIGIFKCYDTRSELINIHCGKWRPELINKYIYIYICHKYSV